MKIFNMSPWVILAVLLGLGTTVGLCVGAFTFRNLPQGMQAEFSVSPSDFLTINAKLNLNGQPVEIRGVVRCRINPYPGLSDQEDFSFPDGFVKEVAPGRDVTLVVRSVCSEKNVEQGVLHFTVIDRKGDDAAVYMTESPQLAGSHVTVKKTKAEDFAEELDQFVYNCDEDGFINTGRIGAWHLPGETFVGDMVSPLGPPPQFNQIEGVSNYIDSSIGENAVGTMLRDWKIHPLGRDENRVCADNSSFIGKGCLSRIQARIQAYALESIDGGTMPTIRVKNGIMQLGDKGVVKVKRVSGDGYAHQLHLALRSGERFFYAQRLEYCYAPVWRY